MSVFSANKPVKTVTIHKGICTKIPRDSLESCGCGDTGETGNQRWWCEQHVCAEEIDEFMNHRHWALMICDTCFAE